MRTELQSSGKLSLDEVEAEVAKARSGSTEQSKVRLKNFFILAKLAEHFHVTVGEHEVNARVAEIAMQNGMRPEAPNKTEKKSSKKTASKKKTKKKTTKKSTKKSPEKS